MTNQAVPMVDEFMSVSELVRQALDVPGIMGLDIQYRQPAYKRGELLFSD